MQRAKGEGQKIRLRVAGCGLKEGIMKALGVRVTTPVSVDGYGNVNGK